MKTHIPRYVAITGVALVALAFAIGGVSVGVGAAIGAIVSLADAWAVTWLVGRMVSGGGMMGRGLAATMLGAKLFILLGLCWALLARWSVNPVGFCVGLGALVVGTLLGASELSPRQARSAEKG